MDYCELNEHVNAYTANTFLHVKVEAVVTARSKSCSAGPTPGLSASTHQEVHVTVPDGRDQGVEVLLHPLGIWA